MPPLIFESESDNIKNIYSQIGDDLIISSGESPDSSPYEEEPVDISTFIEDSNYLNAGKYTYPIVKHDLENIFNGNYTEAVLLEGIGSGKSHTAAVAIAYMVYKTLCLRNPQLYYKLSPDSKIAFMNMSTSAGQARKIVFGRISSMIQNCAWFKRKGYLPNPQKTSELEFPKGIYVIPGSSSETAPLGFDILGAVVDEAAFMVDTKTSGKKSAELGHHNVAEEIFNTMKRRIESRFLNQGLIIVISSPRYKGDFISLKYEEAKENDEIYARRRATFDCKPKDHYCGERFVIDIDRKEILKENGKIVLTDDSNKFYKNNKKWLTVPIEFSKSAQRNILKFMRDICAIASRTADPYIPNYKEWEERALASDLIHPFDPVTRKFADWFKGEGRIGAVHVDLASGKDGRDAVGIALAVLDPKDRSKYKVLFAEALRVREGEKEIDFGEVRDIIIYLKEIGFDIRCVTYDGWESRDSRQILEKKGFNVEYLSMDKTLEPYETFKEVTNEGRVDFYAHEVLLEELDGLELIEGKKVDHPPGGSKDVADAVAGAIYTLVKNPPTVVDLWFGDMG